MRRIIGRKQGGSKKNLCVYCKFLDRSNLICKRDGGRIWARRYTDSYNVLLNLTRMKRHGHYCGRSCVKWEDAEDGKGGER